MPDLAGVSGPFRITTVLDSAHGGYFDFNGGTADSALSYTAANTAIFRSTTRFILSGKNVTGARLLASTVHSPFVTASNNGTITLTMRAAPGFSGRAEMYFIAFNGGTEYTVVG